MEVVVLGGHVIVGQSKNGIAPPGLATWSRIEMVVGVGVLGGHVIVGQSKHGIAPPGLATWSRIEMVVGVDVHLFI